MVKRPPGSRRVESARGPAAWLESALDVFVGACQKVEDAVALAMAPVGDLLTELRRDLTEFARETADRPGEGLTLSACLDRQKMVALFSGAERRAQLASLAEGEAPPPSEEERAARRQLVVGAATFAVGLLAVTVHPLLYVVALPGLAYQAAFGFREAYRGLVQERRINVWATSSLIVVASVAGGVAVAALPLGMLFTSVLRWVLARTETAAQLGISGTFWKQPRHVWLQVGESEVQVEFAQVRPGAVLILSAGETIPVDGTVLTGLAAVDQRMLTGESQPVDRGPGDPIQAGTIVLSGKLHVRVERSGEDTMAAQVARMLADTSAFKHELRLRTERRLDRLSVPFLALSALTLRLWGLDSALGVLWVVPGFRMMFFGPLTMLSFMQATSRRGILLKSGWALEALRRVDTIVFDKTGTLTLGQPNTGRLYCFAELGADAVLGLAAAAEANHVHPIAAAIRACAREHAVAVPVGEASAIAIGAGVHVDVDGQRVLVGSARLMALSGVELPPAALAEQEAVHRTGSSLVFVARAGRLVGGIEIRPAVRPEAAQLVAELRRRGKRIVVLSGDHEAPTRALAEQLGIDAYFAQVLPGDKAQRVRQLQQAGHTVCFVGDGINDAVALQQADVSISLKGAASIATDVAQIVLMSGDLKPLGALFDMADRFEHYMRVNRLACNVPSLLAVGGALAFGWGFTAALLLNHLTTPAALYTAIHPAVADSVGTKPVEPTCGSAIEAHA